VVVVVNPPKEGRGGGGHGVLMASLELQPFCSVWRVSSYEQRVEIEGTHTNTGS